MTDENKVEPSLTKPAQAADAEGLQRAARLGVLALLARSMVLQVAGFAGSIALARLLDPVDFGVFAVVQFALSFFTFFGDAGLAGSLIRQKHEPTQRELSSAFFFQMGMAFCVMLLVFAAAGGLRHVWPELPPGTPWLMRALAVDVLLVALRIVPSILLERQLAFGKLASVEVTMQLIFMGTAIGLAALGYRIWALAVAVLVQGAAGAVVTYLMKPWKPSLAYDWAVLRPILRFGVVYQLKNVVGFINGAITPVFGGIKLGPYALGLVNWAKETGWYPLRFVEITSRVNYPIYSRLHEDRRLFVDTLERSLGNAALATFFFVGFFLGMGREIASVVYGGKWLPAVPMFYAYAAVIGVGFVSPIVGAAFDASGRPGILARLAIGWTILNWIVVPIATYLWGMHGFAYGFIVHVVAGNVAVLVLLRRRLPEARVWPRVRGPLLGAIGTAVLSRFVLAPLVTRLPSFLLASAACGAIYLVLLAVLDRKAVAGLLALLRRSTQAGRSRQ